MSKLDITHQTRALDAFIDTLDNPLHRRIIANYRRHAILEITANADDVFVPEMTVEHPVYWLHLVDQGVSMTLDGLDEVRTFYRSLQASDSTVMVVTDERLTVADWGFTSESVFHSFKHGHAVDPALGVDPNRNYVFHRAMSMMWPYDRQGRMFGEHVVQHAHFEIEEVPDEDYITLAEAREKLLPLLKPLPDLPG